MPMYRALHVLALDAGKGRPFLAITITSGSSPDHACTATKQVPLEDLAEVRDLIGWSLEAYAVAFDQLHEDGWTVNHHAYCEKGEVIFGAEA